MGRIKCSLCLKKKQAKKIIFAPKITLRVDLSDPARNSFFPADFLSAHLQCSQFLSWLASGRVSTRPERMCVFPLRPGLLSEKTA